MCRLCPVPEWGEPIQVAVADLPAYFAQQISWNFERLNFGNCALIDTPSGRAERPSITGKVGCKLKEGMEDLPSKTHSDRYLLVSEVFFCPGRRYGCTPRANCTGKRRHCYAQCKVSIYADNNEMSKIYFSGSHGEGNVTDVHKHRLSSAIRNELKQRRLDGASTDEAVTWFKKFAEDQGLDPDDPRLVPKDLQIKKMVKRLTPTRPTMADTQTVDHLKTENSPKRKKMTQEKDDKSNSSENPKLVATSPSMAQTLGRTTRDNDKDTDNMDKGHDDPSPSPPSNNTMHATFSPLSSPLNTPFILSSSQPDTTSQRNTYYSRITDAVPTGLSSSQFLSGSGSTRGTAPQTLSKKEANLQLEGRDREIALLRHHIRLLEQENLIKISRIAELEMQLNSVKESDLHRLEKQVQRLETENLKKDVCILMLEKRLDESTQIHSCSCHNKSASSSDDQTIVTLDGVEQITAEEEISSD